MNKATIDRLREDTPGCPSKLHFNNAGASLMPRPVVQAIQDHITLESKIGGYEAAAIKREAITRFYELAATLLNCSPHNIAYTNNATDAFSRALSSIPFERGDIIMTSNDDYVSNFISFISLKRRFGIRIVRVPNAEKGGIDVVEAEKMVKKHRPKIFSLTHIPTSSGLIQPAEAIGKICRENQITFLVDACQSVGQINLDVLSIGCDFLSVTSRKFLRGPRGAGFLYVSDRILDKGYHPLFLDMEGADWIGHEDFKIRNSAKRFEDWEFAYALVLGTSQAIEYSLDIGMENIEKRVRKLSTILRIKLSQISGIEVHDRGDNLGGIITITKENCPTDSLYKYLYSQDINTSIVDKSSALIDFEEKAINRALRISPHYYNTESEINKLLDCIETYKCS